MSHQATMNVTATAQQRADLEADERSTAPRQSYVKNWPDGSSAGQANVHVTVKETLNTAAEEWDLKSLGDADHDMDGLEGKVAFVAVSVFVVENRSETLSLTLRPGDENAWGQFFMDDVVIKPLGIVAFVAPASVGVGTTERIFKITPSAAGDVEVRMFIVGITV